MNRVLTVLGAVPGTPYRSFAIGYLWFLLLCSAATLAVLASPLHPVYAWIPGSFLGGSPVVLLVLALYSRSFARQLRRVRSGQYWASWQYEGDEWVWFEEQQWQQAQRETRIARYFTLGVLIIGGGVSGLASRDPLMGLAVGGVLGLVGIAVMGQTYFLGLLRYRRRHQAAGEVRISRESVLQPSGFTPISSFNLKLVEANVEPPAQRGPSVLKLVLGSMTENLVTRKTELRVPIPYGKESEATELTNGLLGASAAGVSRVG